MAAEPDACPGHAPNIWDTLYVTPKPKKGPVMDNPKPTIAEQIAAVALLRTYARRVPQFVNPTAGEEELAKAINTLDDADLFADLDQERDAIEAATKEDPTP